MTEGHDEPRKTAFDTLTESIRSQEEQLDRAQSRISTAIAFKYHHRKFLESEEFWSHVQDFSFDCSGTIYITLIEGSDTAPLRLFAAETGIELSKGWSRYSGIMYAVGECPQTKQRVFITGYKTGRCQVKQVERVVPEHTEKEYELVCEGGAELADEP